MKADDLKTKTADELKKMLLDLRKEQFNLRFQKNGGSLDNTAQMRKIRRTIARAKTFLNTKTREEAAKGKKKAA
ncbi:MAG: 50S ribosomal protein L29 [Micavibrio sp.]|nr:MAG: 50S ribosomal protein L29 [Micavibrio sp.]